MSEYTDPANVGDWRVNASSSKVDWLPSSSFVAANTNTIMDDSEYGNVPGLSGLDGLSNVDWDACDYDVNELMSNADKAKPNPCSPQFALIRGSQLSTLTAPAL